MLELIGQGGMGFVFKARQPKLDRFVALKILPQSLATDPAFAERFKREGRVLARLGHPNIVTVHDFGQANGFFYLLMEFVDGVNLRQAMKAGRFTPAQALAVVPKICEALQYAHSEGVLHRDIKPENILLDSKGRVKIADFGIAKLIGEAQAEPALTGSGAMLGTPHYMAPEQIETPSEVDHRADIYSLGVVFYEMLTGELPLGRFAPPSQKASVDARVDEIVLRALRKERELRQQSATEVKTQVETVAGSALPARTVALNPRTPDAATSAWGKLSRSVSRNKVLLVTSLVLAVAVVGGLIRVVRPPLLPAVAFNGSSRVEIPSSKNLEFGRQPFSVSLWLRTTTRRKNITFMAKRRNAKTDNGWVIHGQEGNQFVFYAAACSQIISSPQDYRDGRWHHLAVVRHDSRVDIYFDSQLVGSGPESCNFQDDHPIYIAMDGLGGDHYQGELAEVCIYNRPLNEDEIADEWNNGQRRKTSVPGPGLVAGYRFDEGTGPVARDFSGAGYDGVFINHPIRSAKTRDRAPHSQQQIASPQIQTASSQLVIDTMQFKAAHPEPGQLNWGFKCFVPPDHLASFLFVRWTNGVPTVDPGFSAYFKVPKAGGIDVPFCSVSCYRIPETQLMANMTNADSRRLLSQWGLSELRPTDVTNVVQWNVNLGLGFTSSRWIAMPPYHRSELQLPQSVRSGRQRAIRLVEFDRPEGDGNHGQSGVELRIFLEPLKSPPIRTVPNEIDQTNYIAGSGLAGTIEEALKTMKNLPIDP
ncbi:MAG: protein kinase [Verrucomicrobia subdivision 3 bacterium]|nr:protein kinase [Limisphaerales bacterium]